MKFLTMTALIGAAAALTACETSANSTPDGIMALQGDARLGPEVDKICFNQSIDGFSENTKNTVVLKKGVNDDYIVEVSGICTALRHAQSIAIDSTLSCVTRGDYLIVSESAFSLNDGTGIGPDRCYIDKIHKWDKRANIRDKMNDEM